LCGQLSLARFSPVIVWRANLRADTEVGACLRCPENGEETNVSLTELPRRNENVLCIIFFYCRDMGYLLFDSPLHVIYLLNMVDRLRFTGHLVLVEILHGLKFTVQFIQNMFCFIQPFGSGVANSAGERAGSNIQRSPNFMLRPHGSDLRQPICHPTQIALSASLPPFPAAKRNDQRQRKSAIVRAVKGRRELEDLKRERLGHT